MAGLQELIRNEADGGISFGNYEATQKMKLDNFQNAGNLYKVKTFREITKLEKNGLFLYESVPGTTVYNFKESDNEITFTVEGNEDAQITVGLKESQNYEVFVDEVSVGTINSGLGGKVSMSTELEAKQTVSLRYILHG
ncbi:MAG: endosialidase [Clostridium sp.]|jgi:hypothetical protein|nr:endosialidase [Clostridium sp.]